MDFMLGEQSLSLASIASMTTTQMISPSSSVFPDRSRSLGFIIFGEIFACVTVSYSNHRGSDGARWVFLFLAFTRLGNKRQDL